MRLTYIFLFIYSLQGLWGQVTLSGSKFSNVVNTVGSPLQLNCASSFNASHYNTPRVIGLWDSSGNNFKGIAYVRKYSSSNQLELEGSFFDPIDGSEVFQQVNDRFEVSLNLTEMAALYSALSIQNDVVTSSQKIILGVANQPRSLMLYDEAKQIVVNNSGTNQITIEGGITVFGHLINHEKHLFYNPVSIRFNNASYETSLAGSYRSGGFVQYGGVHHSNRVPAYYGQGFYTEAAHTFVLMGVSTNGDGLSSNEGGLWFNDANRQRLIDVTSIGAGENNILCRWGNGVIEGGALKLIGASPLTVFGGKGTINILASPGNRVQVLDLGNNNALIDGYFTNTIFNFTNVITPARSVARGSVTQNWYWNEQFSNLVQGTKVSIQRNFDGVLVDSATAGSNGIVDLTVLESTYSGNGTPIANPQYTSWNYSIRKYDQKLISGQFSRITTSLGSAGNSYDVNFGGVVNQIRDYNIKESDPTVVAGYSQIATLNNLYDRAKLWDENNATSNYPAFDKQLVEVEETKLNFGNLHLVIDATATLPFFVDKSTNRITVKSTILSSDTKFYSIITSSTLTFANGGRLEAGYQDSTGIYKYVSINGLVNSNILILDNSTTPPTSIVSITAFTGDYETHFLAPSDTSNIEVLVSRANHSTFQENYPEKELSFVRTPNLQLTQVVAESQIEMLNLATKILQKEEAFYRALDLTNPTLTVTHTLSNMTGSPSVENQEAILSIMYKVFNKVVANRRKLKN